MTIAIAASQNQQSILKQKNWAGDVTIIWAEDHLVLSQTQADFWIDCLGGIDLENAPKPLLVNETMESFQKNIAGEMVARFCGWQSFLERNIWEISLPIDTPVDWLKPLMEKMEQGCEWVNDTPGLVAPRILAQIINEAYFALDEQISTQEEMDTAMKLGVNYPEGPFAWGHKIGLKNIANLLLKLSLQDARFQPSKALIAAMQ